MKNYSYKINESNIDLFFPKTRVKTKKQTIKILLETIRTMLVSEAVESTEADLHFRIIIDKMSRLFYFNKQKYYSISFPFTYIIDNGKLSINYKNIVEVDSRIISHLLEIINDSRFDSDNCLDFIDPICEFEDEYGYKLWFLLKEIIMLEDGYVRFDNDPIAFLKAKEDDKEHTHPENHLDIFYTSGNTFKVGLESLAMAEEFVDYFDSKTDCKYLKQFK